MPLIKSTKPAAVKKNIKTEIAAGKPPKQAVAIAMNVGGQKQARGTPSTKMGSGLGKPHMPKMSAGPSEKPGGMMALKPVEPTPMKGMKATKQPKTPTGTYRALK